MTAERSELVRFVLDDERLVASLRRVVEAMGRVAAACETAYGPEWQKVIARRYRRHLHAERQMARKLRHRNRRRARRARSWAPIWQQMQDAS